MKKFDVIVVGCGAHGSSTSYYLASRGLKTLTLERFALNHSNGSSHGKTRIIRTAYAEHPLYVPLVRKALELWFELQELSGEGVIRLTGGLQVGPPEGSLIRGVMASAKEHGIRCEMMTPREIKDRFPVFSLAEDQTGVFEKIAGILFPELCIKAYVELAQERGSIFHFSEPLIKWTHGRNGDFVVTTEKEQYAATSVVFTAGSWLSSLVSDLELPLTIERQTVFWMRAKETTNLLSVEKMPIFIFEEGLSTSSLFYGTPDVGDGIKVGRHHGGSIADSPEQIVRQVTMRDEAPIRHFLEKRIPIANGDVVSSTTCIYTNTPDRNFIVATHPKYNNLWIVSACSGHGFKFASVLGKTVAQDILGERSELDLSPFKLKRLLK